MKYYIVATYGNGLKHAVDWGRKLSREEADALLPVARKKGFRDAAILDEKAHAALRKSQAEEADRRRRAAAELAGAPARPVHDLRAQSQSAVA